MSLHPVEAQRFVDDLQDAIEQVSAFWIPSDELWRILGRMADEGHVEIPSPDREVGSHEGHQIAERPTLTDAAVPRFCRTCQVEIEPRVRGA